VKLSWRNPMDEKQMQEAVVKVVEEMARVICRGVGGPDCPCAPCTALRLRPLFREGLVGLKLFPRGYHE